MLGRTQLEYFQILYIFMSYDYLEIQIIYLNFSWGFSQDDFISE